MCVLVEGTMGSNCEAHDVACVDVGSPHEYIVGSERIFAFVRRPRYVLNWTSVRRWSTESGK
jgi:hypothetical protein